MKLLLVLGAMVLVTAGMAPHSAAKQEPLWTPTCPAVGCIEHDVESHLPVGAELSFSQCREADGAHFSYRFVREATGWKLVSRRAELRGQCETEDG